MFEEFEQVKHQVGAMSAEMNQPRWQYLHAEAKAGRLYLDPDAALECFNACQTLLDAFRDMSNTARDLEHVSGFGGFDCAADLMQMFREQAAELQSVIRNHITVVAEIRDTIAYSVRRIAEQDQAAAAALARVYPDGLA